MTRALVTGGAGFVGRHITRRLLEDGVEVVCVDSLNPLGGGALPEAWPLFQPSQFKNFDFREGDCRDFFARVSDKFDLVFHLAAIVGGRNVIERQPLACGDNLSIDSAFWQWAAKTRPGYVCYFSSSAVYPVKLQTVKDHIPLTEHLVRPEGAVGQPDMVYGWSKLSGEYLMHVYRQSTGGEAMAFRPFSGYGEDQDLNYPVPSICKRLLESKGDEEVHVWGSGLQQRDFIHIDDVVDFVMRCCELKPSVPAINLSSGKPVSFIELAESVTGIIGYDPKVSGLSDKPEGVFARYGDRAQQDALGLYPKISLEEGLRRSIGYRLDHKKSL